MGFYLGNLATKCESQKEKNDLLNKQIIHDMKSPITALAVGLNKIEESVDTDDEGLALIKLALERIRSLVIPTPTSKFCVRDAVSKTIFETRNTNQRIQIQLNPGSEKVFTKGNEEQFLRILSNLFNNAIEAAATQLLVSISTDEKLTRIEIRDNGEGFEDSYFHFIGQRGITINKNHSGQGLGLSSAIEMIRSWGGTFEISSKENEGTRILISLLKD